jgi:hypothetical protein
MTQQQTTGARHAWRVVAVLLAGLLASCGGSNSTTPTPTPTSVTETFNGTLAVGGTTAFPFTITTPGVLTATLVSLSPQTTITVGFGIGQPSGTTCAFSAGSFTESAKVGQVLSGSIVAGSYCVSVYDIGNLQGSNDFVITVAHS